MVSVTAAHKEVHTYTKNTGGFFWGGETVFFACFFRKSNSFRSLGGLCWPIGVTTALLERLLPAACHKLEKNPEKLRLKSAPNRPLFDRPRYFKFVPGNHFSRDDSTISELQLVLCVCSIEPHRNFPAEPD